MPRYIPAGPGAARDRSGNEGGQTASCCDWGSWSELGGVYRSHAFRDLGRGLAGVGAINALGLILFEPSRRVFFVDFVALAAVVLGLGYAAGGVKQDASADRSSGSGVRTQSEEADWPRPSCVAGGVSLAPMPGAIDFWARCRPTAASGIIGLTVSRNTPDELRFLPVKSLRRAPTVSGGGRAWKGRCVRTKRASGQINCTARIRGSAVLRGRIWVVVDGRCNGHVQLASVPSYEPCTGVCAPVLPASTLIVSGVPRGC